MGGSLGERDLVWADALVDEAGGLGFELAPVDMAPAVLADPFGAAADIRVAAGNDHGRPVDVLGGDAVAEGAVVDTARRELAAALDFDRPGEFPAHAPVGDVAVMTDPVHELAAAEIHVPAPVHVDAGFAVRRVGRRPHPEFVGDLGRRGSDGLLSERPGEIIMAFREADLDSFDLPDPAVADELAEMGRGAW